MDLRKASWNFINTIFSHVKQLSGHSAGITKLEFRADLPKSLEQAHI